MPELLLPTTVVRQSFLDAMAEFVAEGRGGEDDDSMVGTEIRRFGPIWATEHGFAAYVAALLADRLPVTPRPAGFVACTTWWWVEGTDYLGRIALRHRLTERLLNDGGHVGYDVRPSARRRGHATAMLHAVLPMAADLGIDLVLVTCYTDNIASRKVIEANHGELEDERGGKLRFWVPTGLSAS